MHEVRPKKFLGQHFLKDQNIATKIVDALSDDNPIVMEIGPGTGVLTKLLLERSLKQLILVEIDRDSISYIKSTFTAPHIHLIEGDFLKLDLAKHSSDKLSIIGNFPYYISSQIFFRVLEHKALVDEVICMVQKEVADRICAPHGNKTYGILSVLLGAWYEPKMLFKVPPGVFHPPPKVMSAVMSLKRRDKPVLVEDEALFKKIVKQAFQNRRKTLRNALKPIFLPAELTVTDLFDKRAEQLSVEDFINLSNTVQHWKT